MEYNQNEEGVMSSSSAVTRSRVLANLPATTRWPVLVNRATVMDR